MENKSVTLMFTIQELNLVLASLGKQPFEAVSTLVNRIIADAQAQLDEKEASSTE
jgi:hypothetical protein